MGGITIPKSVFLDQSQDMMADLAVLPIKSLVFDGKTTWTHVLTLISEKTDFREFILYYREMSVWIKAKPYYAESFAKTTTEDRESCAAKHNAY